MAAELSPKLLRILHSTLREVERQLEGPERDVVLRDLKQSIVRAISQLELERDGASRDMAPLRNSSHARVDDGGSG